MAPKKGKTMMDVALTKETPLFTVNVVSDGTPVLAVEQPAAAAIITTVGPDGVPITHLIGERRHLRALCMYVLDDGLDECAAQFLLTTENMTPATLLKLLQGDN